MVFEPKLWRLAELIAGKYGDDALTVVTERLHGRLEVQDYRLVIMWARVAEALRKMRPGAKPGRTGKRTRPSLHKLMDDPVMNVIARNEEHRREVHAALRRAKRKRRTDGG